MGRPENTVECANRDQWRAWLAENSETNFGVWLITIKKSAGGALPYDEAVEEALCFGWIDSLPRALDEARTMLWFAPRKPGSLWSRPNRERAERAEREGRMTPLGAAKVRAAKESGTWLALEEVERMVVPADLREAMSAYPQARAHWDAFPPSTRRGILEWIIQAKTQATRAKRIEETARLAAQNLRANQWRAKKPN